VNVAKAHYLRISYKICEAPLVAGQATDEFGPTPRGMTSGAGGFTLELLERIMEAPYQS
jgi:hypothetical protein